MRIITDEVNFKNVVECVIEKLNSTETPRFGSVRAVKTRAWFRQKRHFQVPRLHHRRVGSTERDGEEDLSDDAHKPNGGFC